MCRRITQLEEKLTTWLKSFEEDFLIIVNYVRTYFCFVTPNTQIDKNSIETKNQETSHFDNIIELFISNLVILL